MIKKHKFNQLTVWNKSMDFIESVYKHTNKFPASEKYGLTSQIRRASLSIALNIAEGTGSRSDREFNRYLNISLSSTYEVLCAIEIAKRLDFVANEDGDLLHKLCDEIAAMLYGLKLKLKTN